VIRRTAWILSILCAGVGPAQAQQPPVEDQSAPDRALDVAAPRLSATRTTQAPTIDGKLGDAVWQAASVARRFVQKSPRGGRPPSERTTMRVLYDDDALYVAFDCEQQRAQVVARLARRDHPVESDFVAISIDSRRDGTSAFEFSVNAAGALSDGIRFDDTKLSNDWDEVWEAGTARTERGWSAEFRIPLRILRFAAVEDQEWGFQARRYISMLQETIEWSHIPLTTAGEVSHYGRLGDLKNLAPGGRLELRPFVVARSSWVDLAQDSKLGAGLSAGLDLRIHLTQTLTLDAAFFPDFAQAEADPSVLNLSTFENEYPETRAFFIAGFDVFQSPVPLLYSRRIGLAPQTPDVREGETAAPAKPTKIYAASKLVGTLGSRLTIGALAAVTGRNDVDVQSTEPEMSSSRLAAPLAAQEALRLRVALGQNAHIGLFGTAVNRFEPVSEYPAIGDPEQPAMVLCAGGAVRAPRQRCFHDAYVAGLDGRWRSPSGAYAFSAQAVASAISAGPARQMLDGTVIGHGDLGSGGKLDLAKEGGNVLAGVGFEGRSRHLDFGDLGFMDRQNHLYSTAHLGYRMIDPLPHVLETSVTVSVFDHRDLALMNILHGYAVRTDWKLDSFWSFAAEAYAVPRYFDDRQIGTGAALERAHHVGLDLHVRSDPRRWISVGLDGELQRNSNGAYDTLNGSLIAHPLPQLELELIPQIIYAAGEPHYVGTGESSDVLLFGKQDARSFSTTLRVNYTFRPRLSLQFYSQLFLSAEHYPAFLSYVVTPDQLPRIHLEDLKAAGPPSDNPDTELTSLQVNAVLRWEPLPGSTVFLIFTRSHSPETVLIPGARPGLHPSALRTGPGLDELLLKFVYWLG
jgi:hypothetical protein